MPKRLFMGPTLLILLSCSGVFCAERLSVEWDVQQQAGLRDSSGVRPLWPRERRDCAVARRRPSGSLRGRFSFQFWPHQRSGWHSGIAIADCLTFLRYQLRLRPCAENLHSLDRSEPRSNPWPARRHRRPQQALRRFQLPVLQFQFDRRAGYRQAARCL